MICISNFRIYSKFLIAVLSIVFLNTSKILSTERDLFYLSNNTVFVPGDEVKINFYHLTNKSIELDLTLLKVTDPIKFFNSIVEKSKRYNFDIWGKNNQFLLENTEVVKIWKYYLDGNNPYQNFLDLGKIERSGLYILQVKNKSQIAYCPVLVTRYSIITKEYKSNLMAVVVDIKNGEIIRNSQIITVSNRDELIWHNPDKNGIFFIDDKATQNEVQFYAKTKDEIIPLNIYRIFTEENQWELLGYVYTNQPVYRPSQTVYFKAILRKIKGNEIKNFENQLCRIKIKSPQNKTVYSKELYTNQFGTINDFFLIDQQSEIGNYLIEISSGNYRILGNFAVEEYKKPEFKVLINTNSEHYTFSDTISGRVSANYYFGEKVKNAKVLVNIYKQNFWIPWWRGHHFEWFFDSFQKINPIEIAENQLVKQLEGEFDSEGNFNFSFNPIFEKDFDQKYIISAEVIDQSRRNIVETKEVLVKRGLFTISSSTDRYFYKQNEEVKIRVSIFDFDNKGVIAEFKVVINYPDNIGQKYFNFKDTLFSKTNSDGIGLVLFKPKDSKTGFFSYNIIAIDNRGNQITSSGSFYLGDYSSYFQNSHSNQIEFVTDKQFYEIGDTLNIIIYTPPISQQMLVTIETDELLDYRLLISRNNSASFQYIIQDSHSPNFNISVCFINDKIFYQNSKSIGVIPSSKKLNIEVITKKTKYNPRDSIEYFLIVKDSEGQPVKNTELSFALTDESLYDLVSEQIPSIDKFFLTPKFFFVPSTTSITNFYFNSISRQITYLEEYFFKNDKKNDAIHYNLNYKGKFILTDLNFDIFKLSKLKCLLIGTIKSFNSDIDSLGNFEFKNIPADKYQLFFFNNYGDLVYIKDLVILSNLLKEQIKIDKSLQLKLQQIIDKIEETIPSPTIRTQDLKNQISASETTLLLQKNFTNDLFKSNLVKPTVRKNFLDAISWIPNVYTDSTGKAKINIKLPDNLGTWRATVKGITLENQLGEVINKIISTKNLLVRMETPRFLTVGDETTISTIVHNYLPESKRTTIEFNSANAVLVSSKINSKQLFNNLSNTQNVYDIIIPSNNEIRIDWKIKIREYHNEAIFRASAVTNEESDAIEIITPINPFGIKNFIPIVFDGYDNKIEEEIDIEIPKTTDLKTVNLSFSVTPTLTTSLLNALDELIGYPYGCVEQTMSRFLPTLYVYNFMKQNKLKIESKIFYNIPKYVEEGIKRLVDFQLPNGGWGWWKYDNENPFMTAYVIYGLNFALLNNFTIDQFVINNGIKNLENQIKTYRNDSDLTSLLYMIYVYSDISKNYKLQNIDYTKEKLLQISKNVNDPYSLSLVTLSLKNFNEINLSKSFATRLISLVNQQGQFAYWKSKTEDYCWQNDQVQTTAFAIKALIENYPDNQIITKAINWLLKKREGFSWASTITSAMAIFAITDYLKIKNELNPDFNISISLNGNKIFSQTFSANDILTNASVVRLKNSDKRLLKIGKNKLFIEKSGIGSVYLSGILTYYSNETNNNENNFSVIRNYYLLEPIKLKDKIIYQKKKFKGGIFVGQDLFVETKIKSTRNNLEYLISEDMLPSGFEIVKDIENYQIESGRNSNLSNYYPPIYNYTYREFRDEKVVFFVTNFNNEITFYYIIKAQIPGIYNVNPNQTYLMYYKDFNGDSEAMKIEVKDLKQ